MRIADIPTPALLLDADLFHANVRRMSTFAARHDKKLISTDRGVGYVIKG